MASLSTMHTYLTNNIEDSDLEGLISIAPSANAMASSIIHDDKSAEEMRLRLAKMSDAVRTLLECIGENPDREGLLATPTRYAKALLDLTSGYKTDLKKLLNNALFDEGHGEMVIVKNIEMNSMCEHHLLPFSGKIHIGYIPSCTVIGLSKLARVAEMHSRRLQVQERLTKDVAHTVMELLEPQGVIVLVEASHMCMVMRGVERTGTTTITTCALGNFETDIEKRNEFINLVGVCKT